MQQLVKKLGFKEVSDFYRQVADGALDMNVLIDKYLEIQHGDHVVTGDNVARSADEFVLDEQKAARQLPQNDDVLVIDRNLKGLDYQLARCCNPIYGDDVFGFVTVSGGIKIHRADCPNALRLKEHLAHRIIPAEWAGKGSSLYPITLRVVGHDDIGIVSNITSIIAKEQNVMLRSIDIKSSEDGLFAGTLVIQIDDNKKLNLLIKKIKGVKGVKNVTR
jgi:GTP pyrophosphokinase